MFPDGPVYLSKLKYGQTDSDSVKRLQTRLIELGFKYHSVTGTYLDQTDKSVRAWQASIGDTPDPINKSYIGPKQAEVLFKGSGNIVINDLAVAPLPAGKTTLGRYLRSKGFVVDETNVPYGRKSQWSKVKWIVIHHTASATCTGNETGNANWIKYHGSYPPLAQIMLGGSGKVWLCSKQRVGQSEPGRASHAGFGVYPGIPRNTLNTCSLGIEVQCTGKHKLSTHVRQYETLIKLTAQLCKRYGITEKNVIGHKEWSTTGKKDPLDNMTTFRADVKAALAKL